MATQPSQRTVFFIDDRNIYNGARRAFYDDEPGKHLHFTRGGYDPCALARLVVSRADPTLPPRHLAETRIYTGRPDSTRQPKAAAAHDKQVLTWQRAGATVIARPLRYLNGIGQQKGVDVALAIDVVTMAVDGLYDVGVIASTDTDLRPPIEYVVKKCPHVHIEVTAWGTSAYRQRLSISSKNIWCHWLLQADYDAIADFTDYTR